MAHDLEPGGRPFHICLFRRSKFSFRHGISWQVCLLQAPISYEGEYVFQNVEILYWAQGKCQEDECRPIEVE